MRTSRHIAILALLLAGCATTSTRFMTTWRSPTARPLQPEGRKVLALFMGQTATTRHLAEDALARQLASHGAQGVPAYTVFGDAATDEEPARQKLQELGFSGMVVMRVVGQETEYRYQPDYWYGHPHYRRLWGGGYWGWGWRHVYAPGYLVSDRIVSVETLVYSLEQGELVWAGVSRTVNPERIDSFVAEVAEEGSRELARAGLLAPPPR